MTESGKSKVTVVSAFHNRGDQVVRTVESLLSQDYENLEIVIVDDASTDNTHELLRQYTFDPRVKVITNRENIGFTRSMIVGISSSNGDFVAVQGAGDVSLPNRITEQVSLLDEQPEVGVVGCWYENVVEESGLVRLRTPAAETATLDSLILENVFSHGEVVFRRNAYEQVGGYRREFQYCQDLDLWLRLIQITNFATVKSVLYKRYVLSTGVSYDPRKAVRQMRYGILTRRLAALDADEGRIVLNRLESNGLDSLVSIKDSDFQKAYYRYCLRQIAWGFAVEDRDLDEYMHSTSKRILVKTSRRLFGKRDGNILRNLALKWVGVGAN
jgi:glycosyltransferase involved in cell wall biosynthesis